MARQGDVFLKKKTKPKEKPSMPDSAKALLYRLALIAIVKDEELQCGCGDLPYIDGEQCPKCTALFVLERAGDWPI